MQATASIELCSTFLAAQCRAFGDYKTARRESGFFGISRNATRRDCGKIEEVIALARRPHRGSWKKRETANRVRGRIETIIDYATPQYRVGDNPARWQILKSKLPKRDKISKVNHHAAMSYSEIGTFMADLRGRTSLSARALEFTILTWARSSEALGATWDEFDLDAGIWIIPASRMKAGREHCVPLPPRAVEILRELYARRESSSFVFPGAQIGKALSSASMSKLLDIMGRSDVTLHGFRSTARTWAAERTKFPREAAEVALAHAVGSKVEAAYQRGALLDKRRGLMNAWAEFCAKPAAVGKVVPLHAPMVS